MKVTIKNDTLGEPTERVRLRTHIMNTINHEAYHPLTTATSINPSSKQNGRTRFDIIWKRHILLIKL